MEGGSKPQADLSRLSMQHYQPLPAPSRSLSVRSVSPPPLSLIQRPSCLRQTFGLPPPRTLLEVGSIHAPQPTTHYHTIRASKEKSAGERDRERGAGGGERRDMTSFSSIVYHDATVCVTSQSVLLVRRSSRYPGCMHAQLTLTLKSPPNPNPMRPSRVV